MEQYEIREFYGEEQIPYKKLSAVMFRCKNEQLLDEEAYKKILIAEDEKRGTDFFRLGAFFDGKLYAALEALDCEIMFDGTKCKMSGIGGVISDFNSPFKGAMKQIYKKSFEMMRARGQYISHLYPFEENYYRQYGYDVSCQSATWNIPIEKLCAPKSGIVKPYDGSEQMQKDIRDIFSAFAADKNMLMTKNDASWKAFFEKRNPYAFELCSFVHYDENGKADAYMSYIAQAQADRPQNLVTKELWFRDVVALSGILSYFLTQRAYCDKLVVTLPESVDISPIVDSSGGWGMRDTVRTVKNQGTSRVVDAEEILKIAKYQGEGKVCIRIYEDTYAPWNNDCFTVEFGETTKVMRGGTPDIEMKITSFSSAISGRFSLENLAIFPDVNIKNFENLHKVFYKKHVWTEEHF